jgi:hypothetical protein
VNITETEIIRCCCFHDKNRSNIDTKMNERKKQKTQLYQEEKEHTMHITQTKNAGSRSSLVIRV